MSLIPEIRTQLLDAAGHSRRRRVPAGTLTVAATTLMSIAVAAVFVLALHHARSQRSAGHGAVPGRQALINELAPLRRPQTAVDRAFARQLERHGGTFGPNGPIDSSLVRYIGTTPWGERLFLVPTLPPTRKQLLRVFAGPDGKISPRVHIQFAAFKDESVGVASRGGGGGGATAASLLRYGINGSQGAGRSFAGGSTETRQYLVVPDGVAKVTFLFARQPFPGQYGAPVYHHVFRVTLPVRNNLIAIQVAREATGPAEIWYAADGTVVRRFGNFAALGRVRAGPRPGPETALSRAAETNPSSPNPVWVTPATGGPRTTFTIHFRVLLNGADYRYKFTGTSCPGFTFTGGTGKPGAVRGEIWSDGIHAALGQTLCPGTYHIAVSVMDRGRFATYRHLPAPFGTATFTVR
jgi:hypothetical protein